MSRKIIVGIDEAGRGPLAGPMIIAAVSGISDRLLKGIKDSKQLNKVEREKWYQFLRKKALCRWVWVSAREIDEEGISRSARKGIARLLRSFPEPATRVLLDGSLYAPQEYNQKTIIKGDEKIPIISAASVIAKVTRDRRMLMLHKKYPIYNFAQHKGYGTFAHVAAIRENGLSEIHRKSFCKNFT